MRKFFEMVGLALLLLSATPAHAQPGAARIAEPEEHRYPELDGKTVRSIKVEVRDIFEPSAGALYRQVNSLKVATREEVVLREVLLKEGAPYDDFVRAESMRLLRSVGFVREPEIIVTDDGDVVDVLVRVRDTWTLIPQFSYSTGTGEKNFGVGMADSNVLGYGKRAELLYEEDEGREGIQAVWDDPRLLGTSKRLLLGGFERVDGFTGVALLADPFRTLLQPTAWRISAEGGDSIGRLFEAGEERYIFDQSRLNLSSRYTVAEGDPEVTLYRYSYGFDFLQENFRQADLQDYDDLDLDPEEVSNDPDLLPANRRFIGPVFTIEKIAQDFVSMAYIDRFDRYQDYNLGQEYSATFFIAPKAIGSRDDTLLFSANRNQGFRFGPTEFMRTEIGGATRYSNDGFANTLLRAEAKYYNVLGIIERNGWYLGRHTLAASAFIDYGIDLDRDREFLVGGDNVLRGYEAKAFSGNKRWGLNLENRVHIAEDLFRLVSIGAAAFIDIGGATSESLGRLFTDRTYSDIGIGLRAAFPRSSGSRVLRLDVAFPLRDGPDGSSAFEPRVLLSGGQLFGSQLRSETLGPEQANVAIGLDR